MISKIDYFVKRPGKGRKSFAIVQRTRRDGKATYKYVDNDTLKAINSSLTALSLADANAQVMQLCQSLTAEAKKARGSYVANEANRKLLKEYWDKVYEGRKIIGREQAWNRLRQAVDLCGQTSILAPARSLQQAVDRQCEGVATRQRRAVGALNQIRGYFGARDPLHAEKPAFIDFKYLTQEEVKKVLGHIEEERLKLLFSVLFNTGMRTGEAFFIRPEHYRAPALVVGGQVDRAGVRRGTKTARTRKTLCLPEGDADLRAWLALSERAAVTRNSLARAWRRACIKAFPTSTSKWTCVHDLRHSFAVHLINVKGFSIDTVSKLLGNSAQVCETYYANFAFEDDLLSALAKRL